MNIFAKSNMTSRLGLFCWQKSSITESTHGFSRFSWDDMLVSDISINRIVLEEWRPGKEKQHQRFRFRNRDNES